VPFADRLGLLCAAWQICGFATKHKTVCTTRGERRRLALRLVGPRLPLSA
jgi:hypothetical protein